MLARTLGPNFNQFPCFVQPKLNGVRALFQGNYAHKGDLKIGMTGTFQSRDEKLWNKGVLTHLHLELSRLDLGDLILDGELYVHGWRLQRINGAVATNRKEPSEDTKQVQFHVFDIVDPNRSFSQRWFDLYHPLTATNLPHIKAVPTYQCLNRNELDSHFHQYVSWGYEGIMLRPDGPYEFGQHFGRGGTMTQYRSRTLWKFKSWLDDEFVCVGVTEGEGKASIGIGALQIQPCDKQPWEVPAKVGTGLDDKDRIFYSKEPPIGRLVKVRYLHLTEEGKPFNPSLLCVL